MLPALPYDALECIFEKVEGKQDLARCCLSSRALLSVALAQLYETVHIQALEYQIKVKSGNETLVTMKYGPQPKTTTLLATLRQHSHLHSLVRNVSLTHMLLFTKKEELPPLSLLRPNPTELLDELLELFTSAKHFHLDLPRYYQTEMDEAVGRHQLVTQYNRIPSFSLAQSTERLDVVLRGKYDGFQQSWYYDPPGSSITSLLVQSQHSLRYLSIFLDKDLDLRSFTHLERLRLW